MSVADVLTDGNHWAWGPLTGLILAGMAALIGGGSQDPVVKAMAVITVIICIALGIDLIRPMKKQQDERLLKNLEKNIYPGLTPEQKKYTELIVAWHQRNYGRVPTIRELAVITTRLARHLEAS
jgi:hypothetical protein